MKRIITQTSANNQILVRYVRTHTSNKPRVLTDKTEQKDTAYIGRLQQKLEDVTKLLSHTCTEYSHENYVYPVVDARGYGRTRISALSSGTKIFENNRVGLDACHLVRRVEYFDPDSLQFVTKSYRELADERAALLDILKKSQQTKKKHLGYGSVQSLKRFSASAKQRILEAGSVVDKHTKRESQREVTVTIPGSGWDVYDIVSRYSGYIVNRMTQIVRRLEAEGYKLYWFFVWEHQKRGALHQHWCIASDEPPEFVQNVGRLLVAKWYQLLEELSVKTGIDLFKKKGSFGTWRYSPKKWQCRVNPIRKSVAAYFSKYCSKNDDTSRYNARRRKNSDRLKGTALESSGKRPVYSFCPSRYWGSNSRVKRLCADYRVTVSFDVASKREGDYIAKTIYNWVDSISPEHEKVSRTFKAVQAETGFVYAEGYEYRCWVQADRLEVLIALFRALHLHQVRRTDAVAAICDFDEFINSLLHPCINLSVS